MEQISTEQSQPNNEEIDFDHRTEISSNYLGFAGTLAGLSFTAYYFYIEGADFQNVYVIITSVLLVITSVLFLLATVGYADASKIYKDTIQYRKVGEEKFHVRKVSWQKTIHMADMFTLFGFILMLAALSLGIIVYDMLIGVLSAVIIWSIFIFYMVKSELHG
jgi:sterol desaturase/sphingolipid hydroxylase (fatty acid hydroxylase superfamily)